VVVCCTWRQAQSLSKHSSDNEAVACFCEERLMRTSLKHVMRLVCLDLQLVPRTEIQCNSFGLWSVLVWIATQVAHVVSPVRVAR